MNSSELLSKLRVRSCVNLASSVTFLKSREGGLLELVVTQVDMLDF